MLIKNVSDFNNFLGKCADIKDLSQDERRHQLEKINAKNINEPYNIALLAICVTLPNRLASGIPEIFNKIDKELRV